MKRAPLALPRAVRGLLTALAMRLAVGLAMGAVGCGGPVDTGLPPSETLALGGLTDVGAFTPFVAGQDVTLVEGAQGGYHVWMKFRMDQAEPMHAQVLRTARLDSDGTLVLRAMGTLSVEQAGPWESPSPTPMFMCPSPIGISVIDVPIDFEVSFVADDGSGIAAGRIQLVPRCPDQNREFCLKICSG